MYSYKKPTKTSIKINDSYEGERIEQKISRITNNKEPITDGAPITYTERKNGVEPQYDIRTDRFEIAIDAMDKVSASYKAKREARIVELENYKKANEESKKKHLNDGGPESTQGTTDPK